MSGRIWWVSAVLLLGVIGASPAVAAAVDLYETHCASCHGADRLGATGPALLPESLKRLRRKKALKVVSAGRDATQMPAFGETLNAAQIAELVE